MKFKYWNWTPSAGFGISLILLLAQSCATGSKNRSSSDPDLRSLHEVLSQDVDDPRISKAQNQSFNQGELVVKGIRLAHTQFDYPITINSRVEFWVDYFTGKGRPHFERYLERSEYFIPYITPILKENGMPLDLVYLAMIESGFNNHARSRARAVGPWQFMAATGKRYGLGVNWWVDERRDVHKSTLAAVGYLRDLYLIFGSWELASASYNAGEAKIARGVRRYATKDFWQLARHRFLRPETRDYVPKIIAAAILAKNREQFGFKPQVHQLTKNEAVAPDGELVQLIQSDQPTESDEETARLDAVKADLVQLDEEAVEAGETTTQEMVAPAAVNLVQNTATAGATRVPVVRPVPTPHVTKSGKVGGEDLSEFEVQSPADLLKVARAAGLSYQTVKSLNPELARWCTPPYVKTYRIKLPAFVKDRFIATYNHVAFPRKVQFLQHKAKRGETLAKIARHFGIHVDGVKDLNRVRPQATLAQGSTVLLPMPNDRSRTMASLDVKDPPEKRRVRRASRSKRSRAYRVNYQSRRVARKAALRSTGT